MFTSTATFRLQDCRKVQLFPCGRPRDHEIASITARGRSDADFVLEFSCYPYDRDFHKIKVSLTV